MFAKGYNYRINGFFSQKPTIWQLINILSNEERIIKNNYEGDLEFGLKKFKRYDGDEYISCLPDFIENFESIT